MPGSTPPLSRVRTVPDPPAMRVEYRTIHGYRRAFRTAGTGPPLLLIHGIGDNSSAWEPVISLLGRRYTVIAPDLLGHGLSDKPRADYSVAAFANGMRDLLQVLGIDRVTVVGHSLGGGVAMQFCYQFPQQVERLVLVAAGGVARDVNPMLRLVSLPAINQSLVALRIPGAVAAVRAAGRIGSRLPSGPLPKAVAPDRLLIDHADLSRVLSALADPTAHAAFVRTLRAVVDWRGQVITMLDRAYLTQRLPVLIVWGDADSVIPYAHALMAHSAIPHSRLETFHGSGHFPYRDDPARFAELVHNFIARTVPVQFDAAHWQQMLTDGAHPEDLDTSGVDMEALWAALHAESGAT